MVQETFVVCREQRDGMMSVNILFVVSAAFESIGSMLAIADSPLFNAEEAKKALIGLARDLRGLAFAFNTKPSYMMLFDWMYPFRCMYSS